MGYYKQRIRRPEAVAEDIEAAKAELSEIELLSDDEVCSRYNVDRREEIIRMIREDLYILRGEYEASAQWQAEMDGMDFDDWIDKKSAVSR